MQHIKAFAVVISGKVIFFLPASSVSHSLHQRSLFSSPRLPPPHCSLRDVTPSHRGVIGPMKERTHTRGVKSEVSG